MQHFTWFYLLAGLGVVLAVPSVLTINDANKEPNSSPATSTVLSDNSNGAAEGVTKPEEKKEEKKGEKQEATPSSQTNEHNNHGVVAVSKPVQNDEIKEAILRRLNKLGFEVNENPEKKSENKPGEQQQNLLSAVKQLLSTDEQLPSADQKVSSDQQPPLADQQLSSVDQKLPSTDQQLSLQSSQQLSEDAKLDQSTQQQSSENLPQLAQENSAPQAEVEGMGDDNIQTHIMRSQERFIKEVFQSLRIHLDNLERLQRKLYIEQQLKIFELMAKKNPNVAQ